MDCVIDIQGFRDLFNKFIIKEVAVVFLNNEAQGHWIYTPPYPFTELPLRVQMCNNLETQQCHGLEWFDGEVPSRQLYATLRDITRKVGTVYVYGSEQAKIIENLTARCVVDLTLLDCPKNLEITATTKVCIQHGVHLRHLYTCALSRADFYKNWLVKNYENLAVGQIPGQSQSNLQGDNTLAARVSHQDSNGYSTGHEGSSWLAGCIDGCFSSGSNTRKMD